MEFTTEEDWILTGADWKHGAIYTRAPFKVHTVRTVINSVWKNYNFIKPSMLAPHYKQRLYDESANAIVKWLSDGGSVPVKPLYKYAKECTNRMLCPFSGYLKSNDNMLDYTKEQSLEVVYRMDKLLK